MNSQRLETADRTLQMLFYFACSPSSTAKQLSQHFAIPLSTTYRYIATLKAAGMVQEGVQGTYILGPRCVQLEAAYQKQVGNNFHYKPAMHELATRTGETIALVVPFRHHSVCIDTVESCYPLRYSFTKGAVLPLLRGASAKCMLPYLNQQMIRRLIKQSQVLSPQRKEELVLEIESIRSKGYATSYGEIDDEVWAVGVALFSLDGTLEGSLSTIAPAFRANGRQQFLVQETVKAANEISLDDKELHLL